MTDRKALSREYKEGRIPMGVYRVLNRANGKALVGASPNVSAILRRHRFQLEAAVHSNHALQADWLRHGPEMFDFEVLDVLEPADRPDYDPRDDLRALEQLWLEKLAPFGERGYNATPKTSA